MPRLLRRRELVDDDDWRDAESDTAARAVLVPFELWLRDRERWLTGDRRLGIVLAPGDDVARLAADLDRIELIAIEVGGLAEGRGYSQAQLLRRRYGYAGELRARGAVKLDQVFFLARCGFDSFELDPSVDVEGARAAYDSYSVAYQRAPDAAVAVRDRKATASER
jgi:uncharacterized protein (DUF934 family)